MSERTPIDIARQSITLRSHRPNGDEDREVGDEEFALAQALIAEVEHRERLEASLRAIGAGSIEGAISLVQFVDVARAKAVEETDWHVRRAEAVERARVEASRGGEILPFGSVLALRINEGYASCSVRVDGAERLLIDAPLSHFGLVANKKLQSAYDTFERTIHAPHGGVS